MRGHRVLVTGLGLATGLGLRTEETWEAMKAARSAVRVIPSEADPPFLGCPVPMPGKETFDEPVLNLLGATSLQAMQDARLLVSGRDDDPERTAVLVGLSKGGVRSLGRLNRLVRSSGEEPSSIAQEWGRAWPNAGASALARRYGFRGPCLAPIAACATGVVAVLQGFDLIRRGVCDVALAGGADVSLEPFLLAAFRKMRVLARDAVRPWDCRRSGFVVGEGAGILVLEAEDHARARGVLPYAELAGGAFGADAYHETDLNPDPSNLSTLISLSLKKSQIQPNEIDYVNVHGTATRANDPLECRALRLALGKHAERVACSANKSQIGHLLGAAGAAELAVTCLALRDGFITPTLNLDGPDPACDLDGTPHVGRSRPVRAALKLSVGFGGHLAAAVLRLPEGPRREPPAAPHD